MGQTVTWIVPHPFAYAKPENVDFRLMSIFVDFYTTMLGFINFRLFHKLNLKYPPALVGFSTESQDKTDKTEEVNNALLLVFSSWFCFAVGDILATRNSLANKPRKTTGIVNQAVQAVTLSMPHPKYSYITIASQGRLNSAREINLFEPQGLKLALEPTEAEATNAL